ncbi:hypothetical protein B0H10DRAFT_2074287 [Mycena sp. CBHHK59/15]|nr:hypothetical protein B0H10DRAFT_2103896 [Mycena sp. CBHHK59/15]KAJ6606775.1 hypothetical protein B0H10DRAFT_2074287 [Mycena sp. CBHHK59/15]
MSQIIVIACSSFFLREIRAEPSLEVPKTFKFAFINDREIALPGRCSGPSLRARLGLENLEAQALSPLRPCSGPGPA